MENTSVSKEWLKAFASLNEVQKRLFAAEKSLSLGYGGISEVSRLTGLSRTTITQGQKELLSEKELDDFSGKIRKPGAGRKRTETDPELLKAIDEILSATTAGDPMTCLKWTLKSTRTISEALNKQGFNVSRSSVARILKVQDYSLQSNKKMLSGKDHPDGRIPIL